MQPRQPDDSNRGSAQVAEKGAGGTRRVERLRFARVSLQHVQIFRLLLKISVERNTPEFVLFLDAPSAGRGDSIRCNDRKAARLFITRNKRDGRFCPFFFFFFFFFFLLGGQNCWCVFVIIVVSIWYVACECSRGPWDWWEEQKSASDRSS